MNLQIHSFLICATLLWTLAACSEEQHTITLTTSTEEPAPSIGEVIRTLLEARGYSVILETVTDSAEALNTIKTDHMELAIVEEPDQSQANIVTLAPLYPSVLHVLHRRNFAPENFSTLVRGASVYPGPAGGAAHRLLLQLADDADLDPADFTVLDNPWTESPDVYFIFGGLLSNESQKQLTDYQFFSFAREDDLAGGSEADAIALRLHHLRPFLLPRGVYNQLADGPILTLSIRNILVAHKDLDTNIASDVAALLFRNAQEISRSYPLVTNELNESVNRSDLMLPLHAGTQRYLDRDSPGFIERNVDLLALYLTIFLALLSGLFALWRYRLQARKDRVDDYYSELLEIRCNLEGVDAQMREDQRSRIMAVQHEVMQLLIDERIDADESLTAFISLSNQILLELDRE